MTTTWWWSTATGCRRGVCPRWNRAWWWGSWSLQMLWSSATVTTRFWCTHFEWTFLSHTHTATGRVLGLALAIEVLPNPKASSCGITTGCSWTDTGDRFPCIALLYELVCILMFCLWISIGWRSLFGKSEAFTVKSCICSFFLYSN